MGHTQCAGRGQVRAEFQSLGLVCEKVLDPVTGALVETQIRQLADEDVWDFWC